MRTHKRHYFFTFFAAFAVIIGQALQYCIVIRHKNIALSKPRPTSSSLPGKRCIAQNETSCEAKSAAVATKTATRRNIHVVDKLMFAPLIFFGIFFKVGYKSAGGT
eukprot:GEMP01126345.1.p1 GENE.GEMP01126345.1~~GEMP01126345.1.p1  ORF type:complete len:106 (-),score=12.24 GEMP01126345.1:2-319(-)